ncbi:MULTISPECIES: hypothetical protein [Halorubrum]|uniref:Uncharacterized protein n=1 Tax=Halorubrum sodomense TaxID=35743 RepID=A0A1I6HDI6_HALSD|nr:MULTISPECIES: hypothetical protein [Halorubrum]TKX55902.1 hypothetical protein EXE42_02615 [Halorubrum sp. SP3]TKX71312.1 hypothetical protein EXE45_00085 [Halorubrum sp. SP9]SFR52347.1 hypothetical protein SAMN04487937_2682 [Halorubrum sodomense]
MVNAVRAVGAGVECLGGALLALSRTVDGEVRVGSLAAGFAAGYLYRHARAVAGCRRFRAGPGRSLVVALAWTALGVAIDRSVDEAAARRGFAAGLGLGSAGYWFARRAE